MRSCRRFGLWGLALAATACGGARPIEQDKQSSARLEVVAPEVTGCARVRADALPRPPAGGGRQGSTVAVAGTGARTVAYVADEDERTLWTIDADSGQILGRTGLDGAPSQLLVLPDGRVAVALRSKNEVRIFEPAPMDDTDRGVPMAKRCAMPTAVEPVGLALTPDGDRLVVTSGFGHALAVFDAKTGAPRGEVELPREPRDVLVDDDGRRAFVAHVVGARMSVVDLDPVQAGDLHEAVRDVDLRVRVARRTGVESKLREGCQGFALASVSIDAPSASTSGDGPPPASGRAPEAVRRPRILAPMVTVDPGEPTRRTSGYGERAPTVATEHPMVSVVDVAAERPLSNVVVDEGRQNGAECLLPRAAVERRGKGTALVACMGSDTVVELDAAAVDPARLERRRWSVPAGPTGIAIGDDDTVLVWSQFDHALSRIEVDAMSPIGAGAPRTRRIDLPRDPDAVTPAFLAGRALFHRTDDPRVSGDGRACASCHPDGREDALTWSTPEGPRQTIMLAGRLGEDDALGWYGAHASLEEHLQVTFSRLSGRGLPTAADERAELDALMEYVRTMPGPMPSTRPVDDAARIARGRDVFYADGTGCSTCHVAGGHDGVAHDVGSGTPNERHPDAASNDPRHGRFDTPSLRFVAGTAPYFHDGRYATLADLLAAPDSRMGHTLHLSRTDAVALEAFLESL